MTNESSPLLYEVPGTQPCCYNTTSLDLSTERCPISQLCSAPLPQWVVPWLTIYTNSVTMSKVSPVIAQSNSTTAVRSVLARSQIKLSYHSSKCPGLRCSQTPPLIRRPGLTDWQCVVSGISGVPFLAPDTRLHPHVLSISLLSVGPKPWPTLSQLGEP
ncbi:hypothetical protein AOLI_G00013070 [Acnodon oligacanthus]